MTPLSSLPGLTQRLVCPWDTEFVRAPDSVPRREGRSYTCLSNGKLERNIGECAGSGVLSHFPAERLGVELEFEQPSRGHRTAPHRHADQLHERDLRVRLQGWGAGDQGLLATHIQPTPLSDRQTEIINEAVRETDLVLPAARSKHPRPRTAHTQSWSYLDLSDGLAGAAFACCCDCAGRIRKLPALGTAACRS
jgi:hypothetical protein